MNKGQFDQVSVDTGGGEFEADIIIKQKGIIIIPVDLYLRNLYIRNEEIEGYEDNAGIDIVLLDMNRPLGSKILLRFPSAAAKATFLDYIRQESESSTRDFENSSSSSEQNMV